jgi:outer membrane protein TolC
MIARSITALLMIMSFSTTASGESAAITLQGAYDASLASYEEVKISEENVVQAESKIDQAWTYIYPRLTACGSYTR